MAIAAITAIVTQTHRLPEISSLKSMGLPLKTIVRPAAQWPFQAAP